MEQSSISQLLALGWTATLFFLLFTVPTMRATLLGTITISILIPLVGLAALRRTWMAQIQLVEAN